MADDFAPSDVEIPDNMGNRVDQYKQATAMVREGYALLTGAETMLKAAFGGSGSYDFQTIDHYHHSDCGEILNRIHRNTWKRVVEMSGIQQMMGIKRFESYRKNIDECPIEELPPVESDVILAQLKEIVRAAPTFLQEAVKEVFDAFRCGSRDNYEHNFKTNQKYARFDLGRKLIMTYVVSWHSTSTPSVNSYAEQKLIVLDKVMHAIDGKRMTGGYRSPLVDSIQTSGPKGKGETEYFTFQVYHNGNLHLQFKRLDLLKILNQIATDGTLLKAGDGEPEGVAFHKPVEHAEPKSDGFFETPEAVTLRMLELCPLSETEPQRILEPEAGAGAIVRVLQEQPCSGIHEFTLIEKNLDRRHALNEEFGDVAMHVEDFLTWNGGTFDLIYMNPPFENLQDVRHCRHAYDLLAPCGRMACVMSPSAFTRQDWECTEFRKWLDQVDAYYEELPDGSFKESGTGVKTYLVVIEKNTD